MTTTNLDLQSLTQVAGKLFSEVEQNDLLIGDFCYQLAEHLFPICRSLTGKGTRHTLSILKSLLPDLQTHSVPSGTAAFDWTIPEEWNIREAYIEDENGSRLIDFAENNLHIMGYSEPVDVWLDLPELQNHLHSLPDMPDAIPYITSYYARNWGVCLTDNQRTKLKEGKYHAVIDSTLEPGVLNYGDILIAGDSDEEVLLSTYICHPSMANNELSGPVVATALALWLQSLNKRRFTYRFVFIPETIGSIVYLSKNYQHMKERTIAGYNLTCLGDNRAYSFLPSRAGNTISDKVAKHVLKHVDQDYLEYSWFDRGSDERQYCAPGIDLPVASIMRSKYGEYPEYHTSMDDLSLISPAGLQGGFCALQKAIQIIELDDYPKVTVLGEPQLGKRGLYPSTSTRDTRKTVADMMNTISLCDGEHSILDIAERLQKPFDDINEILTMMKEAELIQY